ncbi:hypothetical protein D3C86_2106510 [compost metagenome]
MDRSERLEPGLLGDILGRCLAYQGSRHGDQEAVMRLNHRLAGDRVALLYTLHQFLFLVHAVPRCPLPPA